MRTRATILAAAFLACPSIASANTGTALMLSTGIHLAFGNLLIGLLEGLALAALFKLPALRATLMMIAANYASAAVGVLCGSLVLDSEHIRLGTAWIYALVALPVAYLITLLSELPFVSYTFPANRRNLRATLRASLVVQTATYVPLVVWYGFVSFTSLYTDAEIVPLARMSLPDEAAVAYLSVDDGEVILRRLAGDERRRLAEPRQAAVESRLVVRPSDKVTETWDLVLHSGDRTHDAVRRVHADFLTAEEAGDAGGIVWNEHGPRWWGSVHKLGSAIESGWSFRTNVWGVGLSGRHTDGRRVHLAWETPAGMLPARYATHLPGDVVVFQLGQDEICVFDPETGQLALVGRGRCPVGTFWSEG